MAELNIPVNDFFGLLINKLELGRGDTVHWTPAAYQILADQAVASIFPALGLPMASSAPSKPTSALPTSAMPTSAMPTNAKPNIAKPNIVFILADDMGYGDVQCLNPQRGKIATPHLDRLAAQGMIFTDAHSSSSVCTPTRYSILTGRYNWRTHLQTFVLNGYSAPLIAADRLTVPSLLKQHGYHTACVGKWHLGMGLPKDEPSPKITEGPTTRGFDYYYGISASLDMPPFAYIENDRFTEPLTTTKKWQRTGPAAASFEAVDVLPALASKSVDYIATQAKTGQPFFLYLPLTSPHTPILPSKEWQGKSSIGKYGDFVMETDWAVGEVMAALEKAGVANNTLIVFTSDNGCSKAAGIPAMEAKGHFPSADLRGSKSDIFDGGHRVPFLMRWPDRIKAGSRSDEVVGQIDLMATCAELLGVKLPANAGEDSVNILPAMLGTAKTPVRDALVHHSIDGSFAIRQGDWKLELCAGSGGWSDPAPGSSAAKGLPDTQLYNLRTDLAEVKNVYAENPEVVARLTKLLENYIAQGRSTPGAKQANDVAIQIRKKADKSAKE
jgi:arylsulfatase A-like enzyme